MPELNSPFFDFHCDPGQGSFSLIPHSAELPGVENARLEVVYLAAGKPLRWLADAWPVETASETDSLIPGAGRIRALRFEISPNPHSMAASIEFALSQERPLALWRVSLANRGDLPLPVSQIELLRTGGHAQSGRLVLPGLKDPSDLSFFSNGWQSWSKSAAYPAGSAAPRSRLGILQNPMVLNPGTPSPGTRGLFGSDFFGVLADRNRRTGLLAGFLSQQQHFGSVEALLFDKPSLRLWANGDDAVLLPGSTIETDWAVLYSFTIDQPDPLDPYLQAVAEFHGVRDDFQVPTGWCSWYRFYQRVTEKNVQANLSSLIEMDDRLPLELVQIDDGFEAQIGDWYDFSPDFPQGVAPLAAEIRARGKVPGLWLAPFAVHPKSRLAKEHPEYLLRGKNGRPVRIGFVWNSLPYALDLTNPDALEYAAGVVRTAAHDWGFPYLKLDFLYAAALSGRYQDPTRTRAQVMRAGLQALRDAAGPETTLLGCGLPLGSAVGLVEAMRISADVGESWRPRYFNIEWPFRGEPGMPSAFNALHNSLTRAFLHCRWWVNDPDCLLVRPDTRLTESEVRTLAAVIGLSGGSLLLSDDLPALPEDRLRIASALLPVVPGRLQVLDWLDATLPRRLRVDLDGLEGPWHVLAWINWDEHPVDWAFTPSAFRLPEQTWLLRSFWDGQTHRWTPGQPLPPAAIPAHGCVVLAVRADQPGRPQYAGSDLHITQGLELAAWEENEQGLRLRLELPRRAEGSVDLKLPAPPAAITAGERDLPWTDLGQGIYRVPVRIDRSLDIHICGEKRPAV